MNFGTMLPLGQALLPAPGEGAVVEYGLMPAGGAVVVNPAPGGAQGATQAHGGAEGPAHAGAGAQSGPAPLLAHPLAQQMAAAMCALTQPQRVVLPPQSSALRFAERYAAAHLRGVADYGSRPPILGRVARFAGPDEYAVDFFFGRRHRRSVASTLFGGEGGGAAKLVRVIIEVPAEVYSRIAIHLPYLAAYATLFTNPRAAVLAADQLDVRMRVASGDLYLCLHDKHEPYGVYSTRIGSATLGENAARAAYGVQGPPPQWIPAEATGVRWAFPLATVQNKYCEAFASLHVQRIVPFGAPVPLLGIVRTGGGNVEYAVEFAHGWRQREQLAADHLPNGIADIGYSRVRTYVSFAPGVVARLPQDLPTLVADNAVAQSTIVLAEGQMDIRVEVAPAALHLVLHERCQPNGVFAWRAARLTTEGNAHGVSAVTAGFGAQHLGVEAVLAGGAYRAPVALGGTVMHGGGAAVASASARAPPAAAPAVENSEDEEMAA